MTKKTAPDTMTAAAMRDAILNGDNTITPEQLAAAVALEQAAREHAELVDLAARRKADQDAAEQLATDQQNVRTEILDPLATQFAALQTKYSDTIEAIRSYTDALTAYQTARTAAGTHAGPVGLGHELAQLPDLNVEEYVALLLVEATPEIRLQPRAGLNVDHDRIKYGHALHSEANKAERRAAQADHAAAIAAATRAYKINAARERLARATPEIVGGCAEHERRQALDTLHELGADPYDPYDPDDPQTAA